MLSVHGDAQAPMFAVRLIVCTPGDREIGVMLPPPLGIAVPAATSPAGWFPATLQSFVRPAPNDALVAETDRRRRGDRRQARDVDCRVGHQNPEAHLGEVALAEEHFVRDVLVNGRTPDKSVFAPPTVMSARLSGLAPVPRGGVEHPVTGGQPPFRM